jgi:hypothetical protein
MRYKLKKAKIYINCPFFNIHNYIIETYHKPCYESIAEDFAKSMLEDKIEFYDENDLENILVYIKKEDDKIWTKIDVGIEIELNYYATIIDDEEENECNNQ